MGNRQGSSKEESKEDKTCEKETQKKQKKSKTSDKKESRKTDHGSVSKLDADIDDSSHVTGGDSESCVYHSAENVSCGSNVDPSTLFEGKHCKIWPGVVDPASECTQHSFVLSSKDFQDGFSLEACIPPEIARPEAHNDSPWTNTKQRHSILRFNSTKVNKAETEATITGREGLSLELDRYKSSTPGTFASSTESKEQCFVSVPTVSTYVLETTKVDYREVQPSSPTSTVHHPHFHNHHYSRKYQPTSPSVHTKNTSPSLKLVSPQNVLPTPTTPVSQRRAGNFLSLFRSNSKPENAASSIDDDKQTDHRSAEINRNFAITNEEVTTKSSPTWKTWERPRSTQMKPKVSIFGTSRKILNNCANTDVKNITDDVGIEDKTQTFSQFDKDKSTHIESCAYSKSVLLSEPKADKVTLPSVLSDKTDGRTIKSAVLSDKTDGKTIKSGVLSDQTDGKTIQSAVLSDQKTGNVTKSASVFNKNEGSVTNSALVFNKNEGSVTKSASVFNKNEGSITKSASLFAKNEDKVSKPSSSYDKNQVTVTKSVAVSDKNQVTVTKSVAVSDKNEGKVIDSNSTSSDCPSMRHWININVESEKMIREDSPHLSTTAAFCILKLEELERSIEKTIKEKFPDAEPFLLRKQSKEELRGSRSLPTTPSLKKKLYLTREEDVNVVGFKQNEEKGTTRFCDESYESPPSPAKSPVVIRRFGARTRHASMSPKIQRAKTAVLFNSPSEITSLHTNIAIKTVTKSPIKQDNLSNQKKHEHNLLTKSDKSLTFVQKSESKYDNVIDSETVDSSFPLLYDSKNKEDKGESKTTTSEYNKVVNDEQTVIIPTFSAVFGSVSPKLKRNTRVKFSDSKISEKDTKQTSENVSYQVNSGNDNEDKNDMTGSLKSLDNSCSPLALPGYRVESSTETSQAMNLSEKGQQGRSGCLVSKALGNVIVGSKHKINQAIARVEPEPDKTSSINRSSISTRACSSEDTVENRNAITELITTQHKIGNVKNDVQQKKAPISLVSSKPACVETLPSTQPRYIYSEKFSEKSGQLESPGTTRKHLSAHVALGSVVALPSRALPSSPGKEIASDVNSSHLAHAQPAIPHPGHELWNVSQQKPIANVEDKIKLLPLRYSSTRTTSNITSITDTLSDSNNTSQNSSQAEATKKVFSLKKINSNVLTINQGHSFRVLNSKCVNSVCPEKEEQIQFDSSRDYQSCETNTNTNANERVTYLLTSAENKTSCQEQERPYFDESTLQESQQQTCLNSDDETLPVLKQPVSEVISQMINLSKRQQQHHKDHHQHHRHQQQRRRHHQTNSPTPHYNIKQATPTVAIVTRPNYEQSCQTLEKKTVTAEGHLPISVTHDVCLSRSQEIQTDSYTTADKSLDSSSLGRTIMSSEMSTTGKSVFSTTQTSDFKLKKDKITGMVDSDESELSKKSLDSDQAQKRTHTDDSRTTKQVPPPSPTVMHQMIDEIQEEVEESEDDIKNKDAVKNTKKEHEIKQFTEIIYKRLSDLLGSQSKDDNNADDDENDTDTFDYENKAAKKTTVKLRRDSLSATSDDAMSHFETNTDIPTSISASNLAKVLTVETSSSLSTTTSSDSDIDEMHRRFQAFQGVDQNDSFENIERYIMDKVEKDASVFRETDTDRLKPEVGQTPTSRVYHSDDDVATGRGIPDYYDDRPLWTRRQKPPGELSATMLAIRWRERRERWLKKRRRNRTDLMSTGSSDTGSENCLPRDYQLIREHSDYFDNENHDNRTTQRKDMGSGILTSPKYTKPILPFFDRSRNRSPVGDTAKYITERAQSLDQHKQRHDNTSNNSSNTNQMTCTQHADNSNNIGVYKKLEHVENTEHTQKEGESNRLSTNVNRIVPTIEDTFQELISVQNILVGMQDLKQTDSDISGRKYLPLTKENVRFIREYDKDGYLAGSGRRSRLSATDRTESDLDLYSEMRDDASSDSEVYADDEGDDDGLETYATAEDDHGATGRSSSSGGRGNRHNRDLSISLEDELDKPVVHSCTFYNSNTQRELSCDITECRPPAIETTTTQRSTSIVRPTTSHPVANSDDEFWTGGTIVDEDYPQLESAANAVSSTFQNARDQMHDIQYHLQALRRQMEVMQDDLTHISITLSPNTSKNELAKNDTHL